MPWYSNIGLVIAGIGALGLVYDFYQNYKKRTIPIMEAVYLVESYLKKKNAKIKHNITDVVFWDCESIYSLFFWLKPPSSDGRDFSPCLS